MIDNDCAWFFSMICDDEGCSPGEDVHCYLCMDSAEGREMLARYSSAVEAALGEVRAGFAPVMEAYRNARSDED